MELKESKIPEMAEKLAKTATIKAPLRSPALTAGTGRAPPEELIKIFALSPLDKAMMAWYSSATVS